MTLTNRLADLRRAKGLTQAQLAEAAGVSRKTINTIERRAYVPSTLLALTLAKVLGTTVEGIFTLADEDSRQ